MHQQNEQLKKLKQDLHQFNTSWHKILESEEVLNNTTFLSEIAGQIEDVHNDIATAKDLSDVKQNAELVDYLLDSRWGAPFVFDKPLLEAAIQYKNAKQSPELQKILKEFLHYKDEIKEQLFDCMEEIEKNIGDNDA